MYKWFFVYLLEKPHLYLAQLLIVIISIFIHRSLHVYTAKAFGDDTYFSSGYSKLNPFQQMGRWTLVMLLFFGVARCKVPLDEDKMRSRFAPAIVALAGIAGNLVLGILLILAATLIGEFGTTKYIFTLNVLFFGGVMNLVLAAINILPIPGWDGYIIFRNLFPVILPRLCKESKLLSFFSFLVVVLLLKRIYLLADVAAIKMVSFFSQVIKCLS